MNNETETDQEAEPTTAELRDLVEAALTEANDAFQAGNHTGVAFAMGCAQVTVGLAIVAAIDRNTAALMQQMEPEPLGEDDDGKGGFTALDQVEPGNTM